MNRFCEKYGPWALITGASSGIGAEFARQLAAKGLNLVLVARRSDRLRELGNMLKQEHKIQSRIVVCDLAELDFLPTLRSMLEGIDVGLLVNNAGFSNTGEFLANDLEKEIELLHVNCRAALILAHEFGKQMKTRKTGGIIFLSSSVAFTPTPFWGNYAASKAYDLFLAEALADEVKESGVDVLALCPGATRSEFQEVANIELEQLPRMAQPLIMDPVQVVELALRKLGRKTTVVVGWQNVLTVLCGRFIPRRLNTRIMRSVINIIRKT
jgi:uncharacterized protein